MVRDGVANIVSRLRERGFEPRRVGHDAWESRCPGHRSSDHSLSITRNEHSHVVLECRALEHCTHTSIIRALGFTNDHLYVETPDWLVSQLRRVALQPSSFATRHGSEDENGVGQALTVGGNRSRLPVNPGWLAGCRVGRPAGAASRAPVGAIADGRCRTMGRSRGTRPWLGGRHVCQYPRGQPGHGERAVARRVTRRRELDRSGDPLPVVPGNHARAAANARSLSAVEHLPRRLAQDPRALSCQLRHLAPQLRSIGIDVEFVRDGQSRIISVAMNEGGDASAIDHRSTMIGERLQAYIQETSRPAR